MMEALNDEPSATILIFTREPVIASGETQRALLQNYVCIVHLPFHRGLR
jgi:hypothetical protein